MALPIDPACPLWRACTPQVPGDLLPLALGLLGAAGAWGLVMWWVGRR
jgi:hypothetical protein